jgi:hypothetical protein
MSIAFGEEVKGTDVYEMEVEVEVTSFLFDVNDFLYCL